MSDTNLRGQRVESENDVVCYSACPVPPLLNLRQISEPIPDFVNREWEISTLLAAFEGAGRGNLILGVCGMAGVGKTELARAVAKRLNTRFPDGQIMFNLRGARDDDATRPATAIEALHHVISSFHPAVRLPEEVGQLQGIYHSVLDGKRVLLLMDNALDAGQLAPLVPPPDGCAMIIASRNHFTLAGMATINLDTLRSEEARKLVLGICPRIGKHADALAERCGYLPLALRLGASALKRNPMLSVEGYIEDLGNERGRLATLDAYKGSTDEERGVRASLGISYRLLEERLHPLWRALAVFPGDFDAGAAATVWQPRDAQEAEENLGDLYTASMVLWDEATKRFRLCDLARDYARARLSEAERAAAGQRHAAHYAGVLRRATDLYKEGGDSILQGLALFDHEWGNIRAGQAWAAAHWDADEIAAKLCSDYPDAGTNCLDLRLHPRERIAWLDVAVAAARKLGNRAAEGNHLGNLGNAYADLGEPRKAIEFYEQQVAIAGEIGYRRGEGAALGNLGIAYATLGQPRKAIECYEQHVAIAREVGDRRGEGNALGNLGLAYADLGEPRKAIEYYNRMLAIHREIGDRRGEGSALGNVGNAYANLGELRRAIEYHEQALVISRVIGDRRAEGHDLGNLGNAYAALGEPRKAIEFYEQCLTIAREIGDRGGEGIALHNLAGALAMTGRRDEAIAHAEQAVKVYEQIETPYGARARAFLEELRKKTDTLKK